MSPLRRPSEEGAPSVSFSGSGFLATYQLGVAQCLLSRAPWILRAAPLVLGSSAGSLVAAAVVCEVKFSTMRDEMLLFASRLRELPLGPLSPSFNIFKWLEYVLRKHLSHDAHRLANGRLAVAVTRLPGNQNAMVSDFRSKEDVVQALLCSCFVPGYCGVTPPSINGVYYMDGGFTSMMPVLAPSQPTLTVSPFSGEMDICPRNESSICDLVVSGTSVKLNRANSLRVVTAFYPTDVESLVNAYHSGYKDAAHFLQSSDLPAFPTGQQLCALIRDIRIKDARHSHGHSEEDEEEVDEESDKEEVEEEEEEEERWEKVRRMSLMAGNKDMWMESMAENELTCNVRPPVQRGFPDLNQALLSYLSYMSVFGFPIVLSYLLLPFHLPVYYVYRQKETMVWLFWVLLGFLQINLFLLNMVVHSVQKNVKDRVIPVLVKLQGLDLQAEYKGPGESNPTSQRYSSLGLHFSRASSFSFSSSSSFNSFSSSSSAMDPVPSSVWLHLELDKEGEQARRRFVRHHSILG